MSQSHASRSVNGARAKAGMPEHATIDCKNAPLGHEMPLPKMLFRIGARPSSRTDCSKPPRGRALLTQQKRRIKPYPWLFLFRCSARTNVLNTCGVDQSGKKNTTAGHSRRRRDGWLHTSSGCPGPRHAGLSLETSNLRYTVGFGGNEDLNHGLLDSHCLLEQRH